jgi:hypothetical protein
MKKNLKRIINDKQTQNLRDVDAKNFQKEF